MLFTEIIAYKCKLLRGTKNIKNRIGLNRIGVYLPSHRGVEQLVARRAHNPKVVGSSPAPATKFNPLPTVGKGFLLFIALTIQKKLKKSLLSTPLTPLFRGEGGIK